MRKLGRNFLVWDSSCLVAYHVPIRQCPPACPRDSGGEAGAQGAKPERKARWTGAAGAGWSQAPPPFATAAGFELRRVEPAPPRPYAAGPRRRSRSARRVGRVRLDCTPPAVFDYASGSAPPACRGTAESKGERKAIDGCGGLHGARFQLAAIGTTSEARSCGCQAVRGAAPPGPRAAGRRRRSWSARRVEVVAWDCAARCNCRLGPLSIRAGSDAGRRSYSNVKRRGSGAGSLRMRCGPAEAEPEREARWAPAAGLHGSVATRRRDPRRDHREPRRPPACCGTAEARAQAKAMRSPPRSDLDCRTNSNARDLARRDHSGNFVC
jgi:hypothetical protein